MPHPNTLNKLGTCIRCWEPKVVRRWARIKLLVQVVGNCKVKQPSSPTQMPPCCQQEEELA